MTENRHNLKVHLQELEESHLKPEIRSSSIELDKILADDFFEYGSSGTVIYKKDCIVEGGIEVGDLSLFEFDIHPLSTESVLTTYRVRDETKNQDTLRSSIWKWIDGRWQLFFHQGTVAKR
ncbi:DUF4440 domain-containing protein [Alkalihalobacillus trypoxylicola]|uniref:DUF4440 domain-containing protein n=1 Tax=Alkalihalobacillus trypoxylicola TaxID=519424 RepID=A0A161Q3V6_9BACI|nr:DUF4440 domain-containing protein [Alkalihalobacillus trypoxylicola]KYG30768.1 DUF4440 domain-containing protein [Alkalihalobacillus trypoxylicola]